MALAYSIKRRGQSGDFQFRLVDITLDNAYAAGGYALSAQQMGLGLNGVILAVIGLGVKAGFLTEWDQVNLKLMVRDASGGVGAATPEVANALAGLNGLVTRVFVIGVGTG